MVFEEKRSGTKRDARGQLQLALKVLMFLESPATSLFDIGWPPQPTGAALSPR
jgi:hypothetical protein